MARPSKQLAAIMKFDEVARECAKAGCQPADVVAVLIRISADIALSTEIVDKKEWLEFASSMWDLTKTDRDSPTIPDTKPAEA